MTAQISRRTILRAGLLGATSLSLPWRANAAWRGYDSAIVIEGLGGPGDLANLEGGPLTPAMVADVRASGITCAHVTIEPVGTTAPDAAFVTAVRDIMRWEREVDTHPEVFARVRTTADILAAKKQTRTGLLYGFQDAVAFETDLARLDDLHRLGIRVIQPTYNRRNLLGDGCLEPADAGLSKTGIEAIERMNALGILVDLSHCGRRTAADAIRISRKPPAFTHTGAHALAEHPRNRTDAELRAVADKGGVNGVYFMPYLAGGKQPMAADVLRHLEHMLQVAGEDHVSIGTDGTISPATLTQAYKDAFARSIRERRAAGIGAPQENEEGYLFVGDLNSARKFEMLADLLANRGHPDRRIEKILGGNLLRVFGEVWGGGTV